MAGFSRARIVPLDDEVSLAFAPRLVVAVWRGKITLTHVLALGREIRAFLPTCRGQGYVQVTVVEPGISWRLEDEVRATSETMQREMQPHIKGLVYVVTQEGFLAATARTVASGFSLVTRAPYPTKVVQNEREAALAMSPLCDVPAIEIERIIAETRASRPSMPARP